jgi:tetratricopeptide (TPR) repeat protein
MGTLASIYHQRGFILGQQDAHAAARAEYEKASAVYEGIGDTDGVAYMLGDAGDCHYREGDIETAARLTSDALAVFRQARNSDGEAFALCNIAEFQIVGGDWHGAAASITQALDAANRLANDYWLSVTALEAAALAVHSGNLRPAARLYGYVRAWREQRAYREAGDAGIQATIERLLSEGVSADEGALLESLGAKLGAADVSELVLSVVDSVTREESDN